MTKPKTPPEPSPPPKKGDPIIEPQPPDWNAMAREQAAEIERGMHVLARAGFTEADAEFLAAL